MKKGKINYGLIIFIIIIVVLFLPIIIDYYKSLKITEVNSSDIVEKMTDKESFILYVGDVDKKLAKDLRKFRDKTVSQYSYKYTVYSVEDNKNIDELFGEDTKIVFVIEGDIQKTYSKYDYSTVNENTDAYLVGNITDDNKSYKVIKDYKEYKDLVKSDEITMAVFGRDTCSYCNLYKVVYNALADKYDLDIYYFNSDSYDKDQYTKIINMDLTVPAKCSSSNKEFNLSDGFGTPLTIFTKKGKIVDCIGGYKSRSELKEKLVSLKLISE